MERYYLEGKSQLQPMTETFRLLVTVHIRVCEGTASSCSAQWGTWGLYVTNEAKGSKVKYIRPYSIVDAMHAKYMLVML